MAHIVIFEVEEPRRVALIAAIKALGGWGVMTPTSFVVESEKAPGAIMEILQPMLGPKDGLWVLNASGPWAGYGDPIVTELVEHWAGPEATWVPLDWDETIGSRR